MFMSFLSQLKCMAFPQERITHRKYRTATVEVHAFPSQRKFMSFHRGGGHMPTVSRESHELSRWTVLYTFNDRSLQCTAGPRHYVRQGMRDTTRELRFVLRLTVALGLTTVTREFKQHTARVDRAGLCKHSRLHAATC